MAVKKKSGSAPVAGDALVQQVLEMLGITVKRANATAPGAPMARLLLENEQATEAHGLAKAKFASVPTFNVALANAAKGLLAHAKEAESAWAAARHVKKKGEGRGVTRKDAEGYRAEVIRASRFLFRRDKKGLAEVERIAEGEGLADLIRDHEELAAFATANAVKYAQAPKLGDVVARCTAFADALKAKRDDTEAQALHEARNRAVVALEGALEEIRDAARFLYEGNAAALAPYLTDRRRRR